MKEKKEKEKKKYLLSLEGFPKGQTRTIAWNIPETGLSNSKEKEKKKKKKYKYLLSLEDKIR